MKVYPHVTTLRSPGRPGPARGGAYPGPARTSGHGLGAADLALSGDEETRRWNC